MSQASPKSGSPAGSPKSGHSQSPAESPKHADPAAEWDGGRSEGRVIFSSTKPLYSYVDQVKRLFADPAKPDELELTGLGSCMPIVVACADVLSTQGAGELTRLETGLGGAKAANKAKISAWVKKTADFDALWAKQQAEKAAVQRQRVESMRNSAFVFIKPHANTPKVQELVKKTLEDKGIRILREGEIPASRIDRKKLIDNHYFAIASKAVLQKPKDLPVPADQFKEKFGVSWDEVLEKGAAFNAVEACKRLGMNGDELEAEWRKTKEAGKLAKFGGGFYCGLIEAPEKDPIYVFNGFFMSMRSKFTVPGESIHYYVVHWDPKDLSWADFRGKLLGATDPKDAPAESLRGIVLKDWQKLGLKSEPNVGDNGVHASASPFEGLAERMNWLRATADADPYGKLLMANGVPPAVIKKWGVDPQIMVDAGGKMGSMFDSVEDLDATDCAKKCAELSRINKPARKERKEHAAKEPKQKGRSRVVKE
eukprot:TRINITY_DN344_c0_g1_i7.p1 TRINITY_DN344_c0_g1~~TRINITY_DN344_c0_g1_i7.p1  ORF type:complete len:482 (+),score=222.60 TRINITY_DN344_c0_g1_i7:100-1545(+)